MPNRNGDWMMKMKSWAMSVIAFSAIILLGWYSGAEYLTRGHDQAFWVAEAFGVGGWLYLRQKVASGQRVFRLSLRVRRIVWTAGVFCFFLVDGWYSGVDLGARGQEATGLILIASMFAGLTWCCPVWTPIKGVFDGRGPMS